MDWSSLDEGDDEGRLQPKAAARRGGAREDLQLDHELDDKVLALARAGTKKVRRGSISGKSRHGVSRRAPEGSSGATLGTGVIIGNQLTTVI